MATDQDPREKVLRDEHLVGEILQRLPSSVSYIRSSSLDTIWRGAAKSHPVLDLFLEHKEPSFLGFVVEVQRPDYREILPLYPAADPKDETAMVMRASLDVSILNDAHILACGGTQVLYAAYSPGHLDPGYHTRCPFSSSGAYRYAGSLIPPIPRPSLQFTENTYGQFGVVMQTSVEEDSPMAFFVKDAAKQFMSFYPGVRFSSDSSVYVHVCVLNNSVWERFVSEPLTPPPYATFHRNPYCVLVGHTLYMMYLVGFLVSFDLDLEYFRVIDLPADLQTTVSSWFDYTVAKGPDSALSLVHFSQGVLNRWVLVVNDDDDASWTLYTSYNILSSLGDMMLSMWHDLMIDVATNWATVQVRCASDEARFVLISVAVNGGLFIADMEKRTLLELHSIGVDGKLGRIFHLGEEWPPKLQA